MSCDYIMLCELGCGTVAVKYTEIVSIELTGECASRITLSNGYSKVVAETPPRILQLIDTVKELCESE